MADFLPPGRCLPGKPSTRAMNRLLSGKKAASGKSLAETSPQIARLPARMLILGSHKFFR